MTRKTFLMTSCALLMPLLALSVSPKPAQARFLFQGLTPLELSACVPRGTEPFKNQPAYRQEADTRPDCGAQKPRKTDKRSTAPQAQQPRKVPQK